MTNNTQNKSKSNTNKTSKINNKSKTNRSISKSKTNNKSKTKNKLKTNKSISKSKIKQTGGYSTCSSSGEKMIKPKYKSVGLFMSDTKYHDEDKDATKFNKVGDLSTLFPGLPPKPPVEKCVIM